MLPPQPQDSPDQRPSAVPVRKRTVFYVSGFDPKGPAHYHRLFVEQAALQSAVTGYSLLVGSRTSPRADVSAWPVTFRDDEGRVVQVDYQLLRWDDVVRRHWPRGRWRLAWVTLVTSLRMFINGSWLSMCRVSWLAGLTLSLPAAIALLGAASVAAGASFVWNLVLGASLSWTALWGLGAGTLAAIAVTLILPTMWRYGQGEWLMRSTASLMRYARGQAQEVDVRIDAWSDILRESIASDQSDEILLVAHSSGCIGAVSALARAIKTLEKTQPITKPLSFMTLGQCIPVLSHQPEASRFREELSHLSRSSALTWVDVSAPPDACCFALSDPCTSPYAAAAGASSVKRLSPRYAEQMDSTSYQELRRDKLRCHFQYLMAFQSPKYYDFFNWVCGPETLQQKTQGIRSITNFKRFSW